MSGRNERGYQADTGLSCAPGNYGGLKSQRHGNHTQRASPFALDTKRCHPRCHGLGVIRERAMQGPVIIGVLVDYKDNHQFAEIVNPEALN